MDLTEPWIDREGRWRRSLPRASEVRAVMGPTDWLWAVVWLGAIVAMVWFIVVASPRPRPGDDALGILRTRFARGEISQEEFERARGALLSEIGEPKK